MNKTFIRIGTKFPHKNKIFEIVDLMEGASTAYSGSLVFYRTDKGELRVKTMEAFLKKFEAFRDEE